MEQIDKEFLREASQKGAYHFIDALCAARSVHFDDEIIGWMNDAARTLLKHDMSEWVASLIAGTHDHPEKPWTKLDKKILTATIAVLVSNGDRNDSFERNTARNSGVCKDDPVFLSVAHMIISDAFEALIERTIDQSTQFTKQRRFSAGDGVAPVMNSLFSFPEILQGLYVPAAHYANHVLKSASSLKRISDTGSLKLEESSRQTSEILHDSFGRANQPKQLRRNAGSSETMAEGRERFGPDIVPEFIRVLEQNPLFYENVKVLCRARPFAHPYAAQAYAVDTRQSAFACLGRALNHIVG